MTNHTDNRHLAPSDHEQGWTAGFIEGAKETRKLAKLLHMVLDDISTCRGELGSDYEFHELSTETVEALDAAYRDARASFANHEHTVAHTQTLRECVLKAAREAIDEMDSCIRVSRAYQRAGERCAEINPDDLKRWRIAFVAAIEETIANPKSELGEVVVTKNEAGQIIAVTRQDKDGNIYQLSQSPNREYISHFLFQAFSWTTFSVVPTLVWWSLGMSLG